jgi:hypothetical protein
MGQLDSTIQPAAPHHELGQRRERGLADAAHDGHVLHLALAQHAQLLAKAVHGGGRGEEPGAAGLGRGDVRRHPKRQSSRVPRRSGTSVNPNLKKQKLKNQEIITL